MAKTSIAKSSKNTCNTYFSYGRLISGIILVIQLHLICRNVNFKVKGAKI